VIKDPVKLATIVKRLLDLAFPPSTDEGVNDLMAAVAAAVNDEVAIAAVDEWIRYQPNCPKPSEMRKLVWEQNEKATPAPEPARAQLPSGPHCPECQGFGIRETEHDAGLTSIASFCECSAGRQKRRAEPDYVDRLHLARKKLLALDGMDTQLRKIPAIRQTFGSDDGYRGEF
jgi:hypothetical protein